MPSVLPVQQRLPSLLDDPIAFAHRGARAHAAENTLSAFALALKLGANGLESDVWSTADDIAVLDHDGVARRRFRSVPISTIRRADLDAHIPTVADVIASVGANFHFSLDVKMSTAVGPLAIAVEQTNFPVHRLWLCSPHPEVLHECAQEIPGCKLVHFTRVDRLATSLEAHLARFQEQGFHALNLHHTEWNGGRVALCHRFGVLAFGWDLQFEEPMRNALRMGLDAVYSDRVDMMTEIFRQEVGAPRLPD